MSSAKLIDEEKNMKPGSEPQVLIDSFLKRRANYGSLEVQSAPEKHRNGGDRILSKDGDILVETTTVGTQTFKKYITDGFTSILELRWIWILFAFLLSYFSSWIFFSLLWWMIAYFRGDLENVGNPAWEPCVSNVDSFVTALLFSVETQQTIGFGYYHIGPRCPEAVTLLGMQAVFGVLLDGLMVGIVFIKLSRANTRKATIVFSKNALITMRDGVLYLMIRVGDMRTKSHLLEARIRAQLISKKVTKEGELIRRHQQELQLITDGEIGSRILLFWPTIILHKIDSSSPLFRVHPTELNFQNQSFEIIVVLEGINESTGLSTQARTSYLPGEILWGHRFEDINSSIGDSASKIDYSRFDCSQPVEIPFASAAEIETMVPDRATAPLV